MQDTVTLEIVLMAKKQTNPITEVAVFSIGFGLLIGVISYFTLTGLRGAPELWGIKRSVAIGVPLAISSAFFLFSGISLAVTKSKWSVFCVTVSAFITAGFYFLFETSTIGFFGAKLTSALIYALPIILFLRGKVASAQIDLEQARNQGSGTTSVETAG